MKAFALAAVIALSAATGAAAEPGAAASSDTGQQVLVLLKMPAPHYRPEGNYSSGYSDAAGRAIRRRTAAALARSNDLANVASWPLPILGLDCYVMDVPAPRRADDVAVELARDPRVEWAQPMNTFRALGHDDPLFAMQPAARRWHLDELHAAATGRDVRVAVVDSSVEATHPDLVGQIAVRANLLGERREQAEAHGTAVAGIIAARADNHVGIVGVAPQARLLALRACWQASADDTLCTSLSLAIALHAAIDQGAQVINLSLGGPADRLIGQLVRTALERGIDVVAAADRKAAQGGFPADVSGVVAVVDDDAGAVPTGMVGAPGTDVPTTLPGARWGVVSGASYAAAHVSGLLAVMRDARAKSGVGLGGIGADLVLLADRRIDACASLRRAGAACLCDCSGPAEMAVSTTQH
jgi:subtilisin family serine protease